MAGHPLKPAIDRRLGELLPHQLANQTQATPLAINLSSRDIWGISQNFSWLSPTKGHIPTRYSPVRHSCISEETLPFDLHV